MALLNPSARGQATPLPLPLRPVPLLAGQAFPVLALVLFAFFFAAAAPSPMFVLLQRSWGFSPSMLTVAFAVYAIALLLALLVAGSLSDHVGRRPVIFGALVLQTAAMLLFLLARSAGGLVLARVVQGLATGIASGAMSAAVVEAAPAGRKQLGALVSSVSPLAGLALGALLSGLLISVVDQPVQLVFGALAVLFAGCAVLVLLVPETASRRPGAWSSLVPRVSVPAQVRAVFVRSVPVLVTVWAIGGLYLGLVPSLIRHVFHLDSGLVNGLAIAVLSGVGAVAPTALKKLAPATTAALGMGSVVLGMGLLLVAFHSVSLPLFFVGTAVAGIGFGAAFSAVVQAMAPLAQAHQRSELFAAIFVLSYLAFSLPAMLAGLLVAPLGLLLTAQGYVSMLLLVAVLGAWTQLRHRGAVAPAPQASAV